MVRKRGGRRRSSKAAASLPPPTAAVVGKTGSLEPGGGSNNLLLPSKSLYLFCAHYPGSSFSYTLYEINLQDEVIVSPTYHPPQNLSPVLELEGYNKYPTGMKCVLLDSKFYILGGELRTNFDTPTQPQHHSEIFPPHVYQFDITTNGFTKTDAPLHTGKPGPCVFAAAGKIYALGTKCCPNLPVGFPDNLSTLVSQIKLFECFDPKTNKWQVLDNPPVDEFIHWMECNVLARSHQVVISGREHNTLVVLVYDFRQEKWRRYVDPPCPNKSRMALIFQEADSPGHLYGLLAHRAPVKSNIDMLRDFKRRPRGDGNDDGFVDLSIPDISRTQFENIFRNHPYVLCVRRLLRYLGDGYFCFMTYGMHAHPDGPDSDGYWPFDSCSRGTTITLFKEISHDRDDGNIDGNSTSTKSGGENPGHSFQAKILRHQEYVMKFPSYNVGKLLTCFVVSHEPKAAEPMKKASPTAKPAKVDSEL